jgi:D-alanyl-D-alanine carboxypeptidase
LDVAAEAHRRQQVRPDVSRPPASRLPQPVPLLTILRNASDRYALKATIFNAMVASKPLLRVAIGDSTDGVAASTEMHFRVGMAAEQFEATLALLLAERNKLDLNDFVSKYIPGYPYANLATIRMVAESSTGFGDYLYGPADRSKGIPSFADLLESDPFQEFTPAELIRRSQPPYQVPQFTNPGKNWMYSHTNFVMLGSILETASGEAYGALLEHMILNPLRLGNTVFPANSDIQSPVLHAFTAERGKYEDSTTWSPS